MASLLATVRELSSHWPELLQGLAVGMEGSSSTLRSRSSRKVLGGLLRRYFLFLAIFAGLFALGLLIVTPVTAVLAFLAPSLLAQGFLFVSHMALESAQLWSPRDTAALLYDELKKLDSAYALEFQRRNEKATIQLQRLSLLGRVQRQGKLSRFFSLSRDSTLLAALGFLPVVGTVFAFLGQGLLVAESFGSTLVQPLLEAQDRSPASREALLAQHKWQIIGFSLPFVLANTIPVLGNAFMPVAVPAAAHLYYKLLAPPVSTTAEQRAAAAAAGGEGEGQAWPQKEQQRQEQPREERQRQQREAPPLAGPVDVMQAASQLLSGGGSFLVQLLLSFAALLPPELSERVPFLGTLASLASSSAFGGKDRNAARDSSSSSTRSGSFTDAGWNRGGGTEKGKGSTGRESAAPSLHQRTFSPSYVKAAAAAAGPQAGVTGKVQELH